MTTFSVEMFGYQQAEGRFRDELSEIGFLGYETIGGDDYDNSIEFYKVDNDVRMTEAQQRVVFDAGFSTAYVNHEDGWETHYNWDQRQPFAMARGWRRRRTENGFDISFWPESWDHPSCAEWLANGYMTIVPDPLDTWVSPSHNPSALAEQGPAQ